MANPLKFTVSVLLICFFTLTINALDPFDDPTLQIIREQDKEEGFDTRHNDDHRPARFLESLQCPDPTADTNTVEIVSGSPYHMGCEVRVTCHHGLVLSTGKPEVLINCIPFPHPCMCMAGWQTVKDFQLMYDLNCTAPNSAGPGHQVLVDREQDNQLDIGTPSVASVPWNQCHDPTPVNGWLVVLSGTPFIISDVTVQISCPPGTEFPDGSAVKTERCLPASTPGHVTGVWVPDYDILTCSKSPV